MDCKPFVHTLREEKKTIVCDHCFGRIVRNRDTTIECTHCLQMYYCCYDCKLSDRKTHQKECHIFKKYYFPYLKHHFYRLILRLYLMTIDDKDIQRQEYELYDGNKRTLDGLEGHLSEIRSDDRRFKHFQYIYETVYYLAQEFNFEFNCQLIYQLFCRLVINHFDIISLNETRAESIGSGLYMRAAVINHSCQPNAAAIYLGTTFVLKAIQKIRVGDEITISYVDLEMDRFRRQNWLKKTFYFDCQCIKCQSNDFGIDFRALDQLKGDLRRESKTISPNWIKISQISDAMIIIFYQIYGRFHPQLIPLLIDILSAKYQNKREDRQQLKNFMTDVRQKVELIYEFNHTLYQTFLACVERKAFFKL